MTGRQVFYELGSTGCSKPRDNPRPAEGLPQRSDTAPKPLTQTETKPISSRMQFLKPPSCSLTTSSCTASAFLFPAVYVYLFPKPQQLQKQILVMQCFVLMQVKYSALFFYLDLACANRFLIYAEINVVITDQFRNTH